jgi:hypothetical protein
VYAILLALILAVGQSTISLEIPAHETYVEEAYVLIQIQLVDEAGDPVTLTDEELRELEALINSELEDGDPEVRLVRP